MKRIHTLIAEDIKEYLEELKDILKEADHIKVIGEAHDGGEAIALTQQLAPDVILMDLKMKPIGGLQAIREIIKIRPSSKILVLTNETSELRMFECLRAGARGYLLKYDSPESIIRGIEAVNDRIMFLTPAHAQRVMDYFGKISSLYEQEMFEQLTPREIDVLKLVAQHYKNPEIADKLGLTSKAVANHVWGIVNKLQVADRAEAIIEAKRRGIGIEL